MFLYQLFVPWEFVSILFSVIGNRDETFDIDDVFDMAYQAFILFIHFLITQDV